MIITTENTCDLGRERLSELGVKEIFMQLSCENSEIPTDDLDLTDFYKYMRQGEVFRTSQVNLQNAKDFFTELSKVDDVLHIGFSSGQSASVQTCKRIADEINAESEHKIYVLDSLCSSAGQGLFVEMVVGYYKDTNCTMKELIDYAENLKYDIAHYFTVDDLKYLERGGRISKTSAMFGKLLKIKPVLRLDRMGRIVAYQKVISRKSSIKRLVELYKELADFSCDFVNISHADCVEDANALKDLTLEVNPKAKISIYQIGATIGSHSGPGTLALFFKRRSDFYNN